MIFFITGGSRGIGAAIAFQAARSGHDVAFTYANNEAAARDVLQKLGEIRPEGRYRAYQLDVRNSADVEKTGETCWRISTPSMP